MKHSGILLAGLATVLVSAPVLAKGGIESPAQQCYGISMVGYDTVINSRLGVPPETVVHLAKLQHLNADDGSYAPFLLKVILDAYFWDETPHEYAVKVMYFCAQNDYKNNKGENLAHVYDLLE